MNDKDREYEKQKLEFEKSLLLRNFEIDNFWKRGWFFGAFLVALIAGYIALKNSTHSDNNDYCIYVSFIGLLVSIAQSLMNRGSKYWQENWQYITKKKEVFLGIDVTNMEKTKNEIYYVDAWIQAKNENWIARSRKFSVTKLTFLVWDIITLSWFFVWNNECNWSIHETFWKFWKYTRHNVFWFHFIICLYIFLFFLGGKAYRKFTKKYNFT